MKFSGHESFSLRYPWLPKAYRYLNDPNASGFQDDEAAMVAMGLGKNMVFALRFWTEVFGLAVQTESRTLQLTPFAHAIFGSGGLDPFLEDPRTLWLLHWNLSVRPNDPLCAWDVLINRWPKTEFTRSEALAAFLRESERQQSSKQHSTVTLMQHFDVFLRTYVPSRSSTTNLEESLDSPLVELALIEQVGERRTGADGKPEAVYAFRRAEKSDVTPELFTYCLERMFTDTSREEATRTFRQVAVEAYSPGQVFRLPEDDVRERLEAYTRRRNTSFTYQPSAVQSILIRKNAATKDTPVRQEAQLLSLLHAVYQTEIAHD